MKSLLGLLRVDKNTLEGRIHTARKPGEKSSLRRVKQAKSPCILAVIVSLDYKSICKLLYTVTVGKSVNET